MATYLISQSDWPDYIHLPASITSTVYDNTVKPYVLQAQDIDLRQILYKDFYDEIMEVAASGSDSANGELTKANYDLLLPYIKPMLVFFAYARYVGKSEIVNSRYGAIQKTNEHSEPISEKKINRLQMQERANAINYLNVMQDYMELNKSKFDTWYRNRDLNDSKRTGLRTWSQ